MKLQKFLTVQILLAPELKMIAARSVSLLLAILVSAAGLFAQQAGNPTNAEKQTIQMLMERIDRLEARVAQLEGAKRPTASEAPAQASSPPESMPSTVEPERMDLSKTLLHIRGFGDVTYHGDTRKGDTTSFSLGQLNLFVTSDVSEKFKFLSEIVFEAGTDNAVGVDVERLLLQYAPNDYFNLSAGRYHTAIGYYNTAYHHSTWLQTATGRPFLFEFEDKGGILPIHNVGVWAAGLIPSGSLGLHYVAEAGNGRASSSSRAEAVQNLVDENNLEAFNLALFARPEKIRGLQVGFSGYRDVLTPLNQARIGETIFDAYGVIVRPNFEWLNEALVIRHAPQGASRIFHTPGFYSQTSKRFGSYRPYFRYQYVNAPDNDPIFGPVYNTPIGLRHGPSAGLRYDASESVAVKLQYDYTLVRHQQAINGLALQLGFTF